MKTQSIDTTLRCLTAGLLALFVICLNGHAQAGQDPIVLGKGVGLFKVGRLLAKDDFNNLNDWVVQTERKPGFPPASVATRDHALDCMLPGTGCTVWFRKKLKPRVVITYEVMCPKADPAIPGVEPRDINNFWMASDPDDPDQGLFDSKRYTGDFGSYDKIHGYYASSGGGSMTLSNRTTRMRRYPREIAGKPTDHPALTDKDENPDYLISPDKWMKVQLVSYDDLAQYIVDDKLVYQLAAGDRIPVESRDGNGKPMMREAVYDPEQYPNYLEGYFGFRMVATHHIYRNFEIHELEPAIPPTPVAKPDHSETYKTASGVDLKLHVFNPPGHQSTDRTPAIIFFFGGGWTNGDPKQFFEQARLLADKGMVAISADYRVKSRNKTTPFESVMDAKSAVRWVRQHAGELGIDTDRIGASGGSAGGHIAACTGVIEDCEEAGDDASISSIPNAMILYNPVLDTTAIGYGLRNVGEARQTEISPCHHIRPGIAPTLLLHGTADKTVPFENAERFCRLMKEAGNRCQLEAFAGQDHGFFNSPSFRPKTKDPTVYNRAMKLTTEFLIQQGYLTPIK